ncbi:MAG: hypothetical protein U1F68_15285 [Gammaproteobacteria bacterium]
MKTVRLELLAKEDRANGWRVSKREARAVGRCLHPNIVAVFDYGEDNITPFIAMEYVKGRELKGICKRSRDQAEHGVMRHHPGVERARLRASQWRHPSRHQACQYPSSWKTARSK